MSFETFWSNACTFARDKPMQTQIDAANASGSVTVRHDAAAARAAQVHIFCQRPRIAAALPFFLRY
jgi:hypothetical protein